MKLRNKKTGEIRELPDGFFCGDNLKKICEDWEDYEETKEYWWISPVDTDVVHCVEDVKDEMDQYNKEIGNYFKTKEEAEKAVEKLKAWKRLKDYNVKFNLDFVKNKIDFTYTINNPLLGVLDGEEQIFNNMKIVFGGEE